MLLRKKKNKPLSELQSLLIYICFFIVVLLMQWSRAGLFIGFWSTVSSLSIIIYLNVIPEILSSLFKIRFKFRSLIRYLWNQEIKVELIIFIVSIPLLFIYPYEIRFYTISITIGGLIVGYILELLLFLGIIKP